MSVRVVVADDHPMFRYGLVMALAAEPGIEVVGEAASGRELLVVAHREQPDVVVTDLSMPDLDGAGAAQRLTRDRPGLGVLVVTMHEDDDSLLGALRAGARGYLVKGAELPEIVRAIRSVAAGEAVYGATIAARILDLASGRAPSGPTLPHLTPRDRDILELMAQGHRNREIATRLGIAEKTVRNHVSAVLLKLQVEDRTAAVLRAREAGLGG